MKELFYDLIMGVISLGMASLYLYFIFIIRSYFSKTSETIDNFFVLNFIKVYKSYLEVRRLNGLKAGFLFYLHFILLAATIVLGYFYERAGIGVHV
jgi:hypothetical protein